MKTIKHIIKDIQGIHARPAGVLVKKVGEFNSKITISHKGKQIDAKRILAVMSLGAKSGEELDFSIEGEDEQYAYETLLEFLKENL
ncbi:HPr family phosphocarrier protein [Helicobacter cholecystus]|uniref:HPr family phosphocarrier protein n=1 Tax=Helicobacter cholecystus TaxID=45498 RepID=A0A3D8IY59_9HELI|nr:HPr family phosphocarrier protein [Helicobacter cholecystus]RDU69554.1 HPr family phosphocarrier protein [Helicobacter cholecystus]VEJ24110.1 Phosphocarrier protein HPr [Helicobacter cholecystus]